MAKPDKHGCDFQLSVPANLAPLAEEMKAVLKEAEALEDEAAIAEFATSERLRRRLAEASRLAILYAARCAAKKP